MVRIRDEGIVQGGSGGSSNVSSGGKGGNDGVGGLVVEAVVVQEHLYTIV